MREFRFNFIVILALILVLGLAVGIQAADNEKYGGTLKYPLPYPQDITTLTPAQSNDVNQRIVTKTIFDTLVKYDEETCKVIPDIAKSYDVSEDGTVYTFHLREGLTFHNGEKLTAEDVKFSFERMMDPDQASTAISAVQNIVGADEFYNKEADEIKGIKVIDDVTVEITLVELDVGFLGHLSNEKVGILPKDYVEKVGNDFGVKPIGSGPFKLVEYSPGEKIVVEAFEDYYGGRPYLDKIEFMLMAESTTRVAAYKSDQLDVDLVSPVQYKVYKNNPEYKDNLVEVPEVWVRCGIFNLDLEKFQDVKVRKAFNYAIDKELIVEKLLNDKAYSAKGFLPPSNVAYNEDLKGYNYDPEKAKELMEAAGYNKDNPLEMHIIGTNNPAWGIPVIEAAMPYLNEAGFKVTTEVVDGATWSTRARSGNFEAFIFSLGGEINPVNQLALFFWSGTPRSATNFGNYNNSEFDKWIEKAMSTVDFEERIDYVQKAENVLVSDAAAWFFNYNKAVAIHKPWIHGMVGNAREMTYQPFAEMWIDDSSPRK